MVVKCVKCTRTNRQGCQKCIYCGSKIPVVINVPTGSLGIKGN